ncbi:MAG: hydantoinase/oxoprolinase family protein [Candidatus Abyssobacteria bacterium SURF_17]|uniref:Hydantoinase/oxoprolinase family protein n=1 Tax=Candidatus Abyssobacteria bacterium SURF_17 TaxID=2093361 RepID=A0A419F2Z5_9BACT|nr:MAG: hydantoinase/oxoprolinase family protein [Candidatus Abyssubacteria bacterium SURF_17]
MLVLGVDTGGTFTDLVLAEDGTLTMLKVASTPRNPAQALLQGIQKLCPGVIPESIVHGSTVATNALLERKGGRVALVTTAGFEDILEIGRQNRPSLYDFEVEKPPPLITRLNIFGVAERTLYDGTVEKAPEAKEVECIAEELVARQFDAVAVCFLHSYANPENERYVASVLEKAGITVSASHQVLPEYREYERFSTTAVNAYVLPVMSSYLGSIEAGLPTSVKLRVMQSNGGSISAARARTEAVQTVLSGPAAGVVGAFEMANQAGFSKVITFDMGGTSTDVSLCDGKISMRTRWAVGSAPIAIPAVDIHTVGAGGGSIAWLDPARLLHVGPQSAGADPGPVCYGQGTDLTVTDANLCLGRLAADHPLAGFMRLDVDRAREYMLKFAKDLQMPPLNAAEGILKIVNATMERAIRVISVERGHDPRQFSLVAFGGAGPMHACDLARALAIPTIIIPDDAGVLSAFGLLMGDIVKDFSQTVLLRVGESPAEHLDEVFSPLEEQARDALNAEGFRPDEIELQRLLDLRYAGQSYEVTVPALSDFLTLFHSEHLRLYGHSNPVRPVELVNVRLRAIGRAQKPRLAPMTEKEELTRDSAVGSSQAIFDGRTYKTPVYERSMLHWGNQFRGPALVTEMSSTTVVAPAFEARVDRYGNIIMTSVTDETRGEYWNREER